MGWASSTPGNVTTLLGEEVLADRVAITGTNQTATLSGPVNLLLTGSGISEFTLAGETVERPSLRVLDAGQSAGELRFSWDGGLERALWEVWSCERLGAQPPSWSLEGYATSSGGLATYQTGVRGQARFYRVRPQE